MQSIEKRIEIKWHIIGFPGYGFGVDKKLYNTQTGRELRQCRNNCSIGYWFGRKFITLKSLRPLLRQPNPAYIPF